MTRPLVLPDHNLIHEVYAVLPVTETIEVDLVACRVYERFQYAADGEAILPSEMEGAVADRLRQLRAKGKAEKVGEGWKRSGAPGSGPEPDALWRSIQEEEPRIPSAPRGVNRKEHAMEDDAVMPYTLRLVTPGFEEGAVDSLLDLAREVIREHHPDLDGAEIAYLLRSGKDKGWWGLARRSTEEGWILSGEVDLSVQVNGLLWGSHLLTTAGRKFLLDFLLSRFTKKTEGKTHMEVADGEERQLYTVERQDLLGLAALIARHPQGHAELAEVAAIRKAIEQPAQYLLDLQAAEEREDEQDEEEKGDDDGEAPNGEPVHYYQPRFVDLGDGQKKVTLRYAGPKRDPAELDGVHVHEDQNAKPGLPAMVGASSLAYDASEEAVHAYQVWLEDELEDKRRAAVKRSKLATLKADLPPDEEVGSESEFEVASDPNAIDSDDDAPAPVEVVGPKRRGLRVAG